MFLNSQENVNCACGCTSTSEKVIRYVDGYLLNGDGLKFGFPLSIPYEKCDIKCDTIQPSGIYSLDTDYKYLFVNMPDITGVYMGVLSSPVAYMKLLIDLDMSSLAINTSNKLTGTITISDNVTSLISLSNIDDVIYNGSGVTWNSTITWNDLSNLYVNYRVSSDEELLLDIDEISVDSSGNFSDTIKYVWDDISITFDIYGNILSNTYSVSIVSVEPVDVYAQSTITYKESYNTSYVKLEHVYSVLPAVHSYMLIPGDDRLLINTSTSNKEIKALYIS